MIVWPLVTQLFTFVKDTYYRSWLRYGWKRNDGSVLPLRDQVLYYSAIGNVTKQI